MYFNYVMKLLYNLDFCISPQGVNSSTQVYNKSKIEF